MTESLIRFSIPGLAPSSWSGNGRVHWRKKHRDGEEYEKNVWACGFGVAALAVRNGILPFAKARVVLTQRAIRPRDPDNFLASFKPGLDALTTKGSWPLGLIRDDTPECVCIEVVTERVRHYADEEVIVEIWRDES